MKAYGELLADALDRGYRVVGLDDWVRGTPESETRVLVLRHDVDQQPSSARRMAALESQLGVRSTWYFRWRTAHPAVVDPIAAAAPVGLHYETLSRTALREGIRHVTPELIERSRATLAREVVAFRERFGGCRSICPHGDTRVPGVRNGVLTEGADLAALGVDFDGDEVLRGRRLGAWLTDRPGGRTWKDGADPHALLERGATPLVAVVHPNHWIPRLTVAADRALSAVLPDHVRLSRPIRTGSDEPPL